MDRNAGESATRKIVKERSNGLCERCGRGGYADLGLEMHHRKNRSQMGKWNPANIVSLCPPCHRWATVNVNDSCMFGFGVKSYQLESEVPVFRWGRWVLLDDDGNIKEVEQ